MEAGAARIEAPPPVEGQDSQHRWKVFKEDEDQVGSRPLAKIRTGKAL
jgi:hypothetical protein